MKYYHTYKGNLINIGDTTDDGEVVSLSESRIEIRKDDGSITRLRPNGPNYVCWSCPPLAIYDRITGERLHSGVVTRTGWYISTIYDECAILVRNAAGNSGIPDTDNTIWLELAANKNHIRAGVELVSYPAFEELSQRKREIVSGVPHVRGARRQLFKAEDCVLMDGVYRQISACHILAATGRLVLTVPAGHTVVVGGAYAPDRETIRLTAGAHAGELAYLYDTYVCANGDVVLESETTIIRDANSERRVLNVPEDSVFIDGVAHTPDSVAACAATGRILWRPNMRRSNGLLYDREWFNRNSTGCSSCGSYFILPSGSTHQRCETCRVEGKYRIRSYSNRESNFMKPELDVPIKFGIELEVGCDRGTTRSKCAVTMVDAVNTEDYVTLKEDGSISECSGFEVVTRPDCPTVHKRIWSAALAVPEVRQQMSSWTNGKCGIHIHVSRKPLSPLWVGRMLVFINSDNMKDLVHAVAGRGTSSYTRYIKKKLTDGVEFGDDRYEALNTSGDYTIEFRIFRGTLDPAGFIKNIEFVEAVLAYCKPAARSLRDIDNPAKFIEFVYKSRKQYPTLNVFLQTKCIR